MLLLLQLLSSFLLLYSFITKLLYRKCQFPEWNLKMLRQNIAKLYFVVILLYAFFHIILEEMKGLFKNLSSWENLVTRLLLLEAISLHISEGVVQRYSVKKTLAQVFSCEFCEISKNIFIHRTPLISDGYFHQKALPIFYINPSENNSLEENLAIKKCKSPRVWPKLLHFPLY